MLWNQPIEPLSFTAILAVAGKHGRKIRIGKINRADSWGVLYLKQISRAGAINYIHSIWRSYCLSMPFISASGTTRQIWGIWKLRPAYSPEKPNLGQNRWCFVPCDLEIWWMTLENNRTPLLSCFKLCVTFHSHRWIQTGVTVRKRPIWVKFDNF